MTVELELSAAPAGSVRAVFVAGSAALSFSSSSERLAGDAGESAMVLRVRAQHNVGVP